MISNGVSPETTELPKGKRKNTRHRVKQLPPAGEREGYNLLDIPPHFRSRKFKPRWRKTDADTPSFLYDRTREPKKGFPVSR